MKQLFCLVLTGVFAGSVLSAVSQDRKSPEQLSRAHLQQLGEPGPEHEALSGYSGTWKVSVLFGSAQAPPLYVGTSANRMVVGGRFLLCEFKAAGRGGTTEGIFTLGFDRRHAEYTIQSMDSWGTYFVTARGKQQSGSKRIKLYGTDDDPHMKSMGFIKEFSYVINLEGADEFAIEVLMIDTRTAERREQKMMVYEFVRQKPASLTN